MFRLAHLSDVHLGPLPRGAALRNFAAKRLIGFLSWRLNRHRLHLPSVADAIAADLLETAPDHIAFTGDVVNIAAHAEFPRAAAWMQQFGDGKAMTFVPGNHDAYVEVPWATGLGHMAPWMAGEMRVFETQSWPRLQTSFPFVRLRKNVALIGLSSAVPQSLRKAGGTLGPVQLKSLAILLKDLRERGFARIVMIHHPPFPDLAPARKALTDAESLKAVIVEEGAELILHGHNHRHMVNPLKTRFGTAHAIGVPSASMGVSDGHTPAAWYLYEIVRNGGRWAIVLRPRTFNPAAGTLAWGPELPLST